MHIEYKLSIRHGVGSSCHRHNAVRNILARSLFREAGFAYNLKVPLLLPGTAQRLADILVQPSPPSLRQPMEKPAAYDVKIRSPYRCGVIANVAQQKAAGAEEAHEDKIRTHTRNVGDTLQLTGTRELPELDWTFAPLAFDTLEAMSQRTLSVIETHARRIAARSYCSIAMTKARVLQQQQLNSVIRPQPPHLYMVCSIANSRCDHTNDLRVLVV